MDWTPEWSRTRMSVLDRDGWTCRECGVVAAREDADALHAHHVRPRADGGPDDTPNLLTLCEGCHTGKHSGRTTYYDSEFVQTVRGYGPMSTGEVADWMGCSRTTARRRLSALASSDEVRRCDGSDRILWRAPRSLAGRVLAAISPFRT